MPPATGSRVSAAPPIDRLESVQVLRGVAAMLVVFINAGIFLALDDEYDLGVSHLVPSRAVAMMGAIGVDLFFVISGFVMALGARRIAGASGARLFLVQRFVRIAPLFYLACLVMLADLVRVGLPIDSTAVLNSITFIPFFDGASYTFPLHFLGWTLAFEFIFYLTVAVLIVSGRAGRQGLLLMAIAVAPLVGYLFDVGHAAWKMFTNPILWEFALGVGACMLYESGRLQSLRRPLATLTAIAALALAATAWLWPEQIVILNDGTVSGDGSLVRTLAWGVPAFLVFCTVVGGRSAFEGPAGQLMKGLGNASYSIYLSHLFVVIVMQKIVERLPFNADLVVIATVLASVVAGIIVYRLAEKPLLDLGRQRLRAWYAPAIPDQPPLTSRP